MTASTKQNLAWRVDCEFGATAGKFELAKVAKKNNLDAIHDTVHEMAATRRDTARRSRVCWIAISASNSKIRLFKGEAARTLLPLSGCQKKPGTVNAVNRPLAEYGCAVKYDL